MDPKTYSPQTPPPNYQQSVQVNTGQMGPNPQQQHQQYHHHHQQANVYPVHPVHMQPPPPVINEQGRFSLLSGDSKELIHRN